MSKRVARNRVRTEPGYPSTGPGVVMGRVYDRRMKDGKILFENDLTLSLSNSDYGRYDRVCDESHGRPPYHIGGPFFKVHYERPVQFVGGGEYFRWFSSAYPPSNGEVRSYYSGQFTRPFIPTGIANYMIPLVNEAKSLTSMGSSSTFLSPDDLSSLGNRAYSRLRPKVEKAGLAQAVIELRDVPKMLRTSARGFKDLFLTLGGVGSLSMISPKRISDHYINHMFGWRPFVKDLTDTVDVCINFDHYAEQASRSNGKWRRKFFTEIETQSDTLAYSENDWKIAPAPFGQALGIGAKAHYTIRKVSKTRVWYEGLFRSYRPEFDKRVKMHPTLRKLRQALTLLGANINPVLVWKVTPWSWLIDWFIDVGSTIQRIQDIIDQTVVAKYFYLMRTIEEEFHLKQVYTGLDGVASMFEWKYGVHSKRRVSSGSPFAFSLSPVSLNPTQLSILAALGISKLAP